MIIWCHKAVPHPSLPSALDWCRSQSRWSRCSWSLSCPASCRSGSRTACCPVPLSCWSHKCRSLALAHRAPWGWAEYSRGTKKVHIPWVLPQPACQSSYQDWHPQGRGHGWKPPGGSFSATKTHFLVIMEDCNNLWRIVCNLLLLEFGDQVLADHAGTNLLDWEKSLLRFFWKHT